MDPDFAAWTARIQAFADAQWGPHMRRLPMRREDKEGIVAIHWRGVPDEEAARQAAAELAERVQEARRARPVHWGRKVLELRPPIPMDKGRGIAWVLEGTGMRNALYVGDDRTDVDAFRGLRAMVADGRLDHAVCVGVRSDEIPEEVAAESDLLVDGAAGVRGLLEALAAA